MNLKDVALAWKFWELAFAFAFYGTPMPSSQTPREQHFIHTSSSLAPPALYTSVVANPRVNTTATVALAPLRNLFSLRKEMSAISGISSVVHLRPNRAASARHPVRATTTAAVPAASSGTSGDTATPRRYRPFKLPTARSSAIVCVHSLGG